MVKHSKAEFGRTYTAGPSFDASPMTKDVTNPKDIQTENQSSIFALERAWQHFFRIVSSVPSIVYRTQNIPDAYRRFYTTPCHQRMPRTTILSPR